MATYDWDINPDKYLKDDKGDFILKMDGTPRKHYAYLKDWAI